MAGDTLLFDLAYELLTTAAAALSDPPDRQYVTDGTPQDEPGCRALTVYLDPNGGLAHSTNPRARGSASPNSPTVKTNQRQARFLVRLISDGCYPTVNDDGGTPTVDEFNAASENVLTDRMDLWTALRDAARARPRTLFATLIDAGSDALEVAPPVQAVGPSGGVAGTVVAVTVDLIRLPRSS